MSAYTACMVPRFTAALESFPHAASARATSTVTAAIPFNGVPSNGVRFMRAVSLTVLVAARDAGARRVVCASSSSVYGGAEQLPTPETAPLLPRSPYAVSKLAGEHYCRVFWELFGLETVALRYFNVYGPRQRPDSRYAAVIPLFVDALLRGLPPEVHGDGLPSRDFTFITDAVASNLSAATAPRQNCSG